MKGEGMNRRSFFGAAAGTGLALGACPRSFSAALPPKGRDGTGKQWDGVLAGYKLKDLRKKYWSEMFDEYLPFFIHHAVDKQNGGFMCSLDHDGTLVRSNKFGWFQGRGVWWLSYVYNHFERNDEYLEMARKTLDFMLEHFPEEPGSIRWASDVERDGSVISPYNGDPFPCYFGIEGMLEFASATKDEALRDQAAVLFKKQVAHVRRPDALYFSDPPGTQGFNLYMLNLQIATRYLMEWQDPEIEKIAAETVDIIMNRFYRPEIKMFNEKLANDLSRTEDWKDHASMGHGIEVMWMVCQEALRINDPDLFKLAAQRMYDNFEIGWDHVFGGMAHAIMVDHGGYQWPTIRPAGSSLVFEGVGEYNYLKALWVHAEGLVGAMIVYERMGEKWAADFLCRTQKALDEKLSLRPYGHPLHILFTDRRFSFEPHTSRKGNYHYPRALLYCIQSLDRLIGNAGRPLGL